MNTTNTTTRSRSAQSRAPPRARGPYARAVYFASAEAAEKAARRRWPGVPLAR